MDTTLADVSAVVVASKLAAGGEALRAVGTHTPALLPVANRPLAAHALAALARAGVRHVVVTGDASRCEAVREGLMHGRPDSVELEFHEEALAGAVLRAREGGAGGPIILQSAEYLFRDDFARLVSRVRDEALDALVVTERMPGQPLGLLGPPTGRFRRASLSGVQLLGRACADFGAELDAEPGVEASIEHLADRLRARGRPVRTAEVENGWRLGAGPAEALLEGNRLALDDIRRSVPAETIEGESSVEGRVEVHPTARIIDSRVRGPAVIGAGAVVSFGAYVGPYTSVGARAVITTSEVENAILLDGARVERLGAQRLEGSIVGRDAQITREFRSPAGLHAVLAEGARVAIS